MEKRPVRGVLLAEPEPLAVEQLIQIHDTVYVEAVRTGKPRWLAESNGFSWDRGLWNAVCSSNGGVVAAALEAFRTGRNSGSLSSGLHHASAGSGNGFCTFNGLALAARAAIAAGAVRVLIIDLDAHCGGGSMSIMRQWPEIVHLDIAVSEADTYEVEPASRSTLDLLRTADTHLPTLERRLRALDDMPFSVVIYNAGTDPHQASLGGLPGITFSLLAERERLVFNWAEVRRVPIAFALAGGYTGEDLSERDLAGLHRLTVAAAAQANAGEPLSVHDIMDAAYAGPHEGREGFAYDANGRKTDAGFHDELLGDDDLFTFDIDDYLKLTSENRQRFDNERHDLPGSHDEFLRRLLQQRVVLGVMKRPV